MVTWVHSMPFLSIKHEASKNSRWITFETTVSKYYGIASILPFFILNKWLRLLEILLPYHQNIISITHFLVMSERWLIIVGI